MQATKRSWEFNGSTIYEEQVKIYKADDYIRGELPVPLTELLEMMSNHEEDWGPLSTTGRVAVPIAHLVNKRADTVFTILRNNKIRLSVAVLNGFVHGIPCRDSHCC